MPTRTKPVGHAQLPTDQVHPNPDQPRKQFDPEAQRALQLSLSQRGLINPIAVVQRAEGGYLLIAGERRYRAAKALGWQAIEARIWPVNTPASEVELLAVVENLQRRDLDPIDEARAYKTLQDPPLRMTQRAIARLVGRPQSVIGLAVSLLEQPEAIQSLIVRTIISPGHVRYLSQISDISQRLELADKAGKEGWSVRELERQVRTLLAKSNHGKPVEGVSSAPEPQPTKVDAAAAPPRIEQVEQKTAGSIQGFTSIETAKADASAGAAEVKRVQEVDRQQTSADPLAECWFWADQSAPSGASLRTSYSLESGWKLAVTFSQADPLHARSEMGRWLIAFGQRLLPELTPTTSPAPPAPQMLEATYVNGHRLQLRWTSSGEGCSYRIYCTPEDLNDFTAMGEAPIQSTGAIVDRWADAYQWYRLAVLTIDPLGRESALSQTVRFEMNGLNQVNSVEAVSEV